MLYPVRKGADGVYFLYEHRPVSHRIHYRALDVGDTRAINFKLYGRDVLGIRAAVSLLCAELGVETSVGALASAPGRGCVAEVVESRIALVPIASRRRRHRGGGGITALSERARCRIECAGPIPESVLLVDDLCTTGRTMEVCAELLRAFGVRRVEKFAVGHQEGGENAVAYVLRIGEPAGVAEVRRGGSFPDGFKFQTDAASAEELMAAGSVPLLTARISSTVVEVLKRR